MTVSDPQPAVTEAWGGLGHMHLYIYFNEFLLLG